MPPQLVGIWANSAAPVTVFEPQFVKQYWWYCGGVDWLDIWLYRSNAPDSTLTHPEKHQSTDVALLVLYNGTALSAVQFLNISKNDVTRLVSS